MYIRANMNIHALTRGMRNDEKVVGLRTCFFSSEYMYTYIHIHAYISAQRVYVATSRALAQLKCRYKLIYTSVIVTLARCDRILKNAFNTAKHFLPSFLPEDFSTPIFNASRERNWPIVIRSTNSKVEEGFLLIQ